MKKIIAMKVEEDDLVLVKKVADSRGENVSSFLRRALRRELASLSYYPADVKKALGLQQVESEECRSA
jgi:hypothetical protein